MHQQFFTQQGLGMHHTMSNPTLCTLHCFRGWLQCCHACLDYNNVMHITVIQLD